MSYTFVMFHCTLPALIILLIATSAHAKDIIRGEVVGVSDGDTITVLVDKEEL